MRTSASMLDWKYFPHVFDRIYNYLDAEGLNAVRPTCTALRARVETDLWEHITLSHKTLMAPSSDGTSRPVAIIYTNSQTYSTRYGCPLPRVYEDGHPDITKTVTVVHPPGEVQGDAMIFCEAEWPDFDENTVTHSPCPTANRLWSIGYALDFNVAVQLLQPDTYCCPETNITLHAGEFPQCISAHSLRSMSHDTSDSTSQLTRCTSHHVFNLSYPCKGLDETWPIGISARFDFRIGPVTFILRPEEVVNTSDPDPAHVHPTGVEWFVKEMAEAAKDDFCGRVTFVAIDSWPPGAPHGRRQSTPQTTEQAFRMALKANEKYWRTVWPRNTKFLKNVEIISWEQLRERVGDATCSLLARDVPPPTSVKAARMTMTDPPIPDA